jgi:hypothetical protein
MRQGSKHAGAIAGIVVGTARTAVIHTTTEVISITHNTVATLTFDMRDKPHATAFPLLIRTI